MAIRWSFDVFLDSLVLFMHLVDLYSKYKPSFEPGYIQILNAKVSLIEPE